MEWLYDTNSILQFFSGHMQFGEYVDKKQIIVVILSV